MKFKVTGKVLRKDGSKRPFHMIIEAPSKKEALQMATKRLEETEEKPETIKAAYWDKDVEEVFKGKRTIKTHSLIKACVFHNQTHPLTEFGKNRKSSDGYNNICKKGMLQLREMRKRGENVEAFLTRPRGRMLEEMNEPLQPPRKHLIDGELYVNIKDLVNIINRPR